MAWARNGTPDTLSGTNATMTITDLTSSKFNVFLSHMIDPSTNLSVNADFDNDTSTSYADRQSLSGAADTTATSQTHFNQDADTGNDDDRFTVWYWCNISGEEKLGIGFMVNRNTAGAANPPPRGEIVSKFDTTAGQFSEVDYDTSTGTMGIGSNLTALTGDETETVTLQDGTIFEETDTNKAYIWNSSTETWTQL